MSISRKNKRSAGKPGRAQFRQDADLGGLSENPAAGEQKKAHDTTAPKLFILAVGALLALTFFIYLPSVEYGFLRMDDELYVYGNAQVKSGLSLKSVRWALTSEAVGNWHPLTVLSLMLDCELSNCSPKWLRFVNIILHLAAVLFLTTDFWRLTGKAWQSLFVGAVFALHPAHVESVALVSERKDVLSGLFLALLLLFYGCYLRRPGRVWYGFTAAAFVLGLLSKPMLVSVPLLLLLIDYWPGDRARGNTPAGVDWPKTRRLLVEKLLFVMIAALFCGATIWAQRAAGAMGSLDDAPIPLRLCNAALSYLTYAVRFFWPGGLTGLYPFPEGLPPLWQPFLAVSLLAFVTWLLVYWARSMPFLGMGWLWFGVTLLPVIGLVQVGPQARADRYTYIPYIGLSIAAAWGFPILARRLWPRSWRRVLGAAAFAAVLGMGIASARYLPHWRDDISFWRRVVDIQPWYARGYYNLALAHSAAGDAETAMQLYRRQLEIQPLSRDANFNLGVILFSQKRYQEAMEYYGRELAMNAAHAPSHNNLGVVLSKLGRRKEAMEHYRAAWEADPKRMDALGNWAEDLAAEGDFAGAKGKYEKILELSPDTLSAYLGLSKLSEKQGDLAGAAAYLKAAAKAFSEDADIMNRLGAIESERGDHQAAADDFKRALELSPGHELARYNLAVTLKTLGRLKEAEKEYRELLQLNPEHYWAHNDLGVLLGDAGDKKGAVSHLQRALEIDPDAQAAKHNLSLYK